jgi:hypothetical protein
MIIFSSIFDRSNVYDLIKDLQSGSRDRALLEINEGLGQKYKVTTVVYLSFAHTWDENIQYAVTHHHPNPRRRPNGITTGPAPPSPFSWRSPWPGWGTGCDPRVRWPGNKKSKKSVGRTPQQSVQTVTGAADPADCSPRHPSGCSGRTSNRTPG